MFKEDPQYFHENGWALFGLYRTYDAAGKKEEAAATLARFKKAWKFADVKLKAARF